MTARKVVIAEDFLFSGGKVPHSSVHGLRRSTGLSAAVALFQPLSRAAIGVKVSTPFSRYVVTMRKASGLYHASPTPGRVAR